VFLSVHQSTSHLRAFAGQTGSMLM
jgi:hypothetical protein